MLATAVRQTRHRLDVDFSERNARLLDLARESGRFDVRLRRLPAGDYLIAGAVLVERKTYADFATSLADGRLFSQVAALAHSPIGRSSSSKVLSRRACPTCILTP